MAIRLMSARSDEPFRYRFLKSAELGIEGGTGLLVIEYYGETLPNPDKKKFTEFTPLGSIDRKAAGKILGHLALYRVRG